MNEELTPEEFAFHLAEVTLKLMDLTEAHNKLVDLFRETIDALKDLPCQKGGTV